VIGGDPVTFGIVASVNRPGGNITGMTWAGSETVAKRLGVMLELVPTAADVAVLANPKNPISEAQLTELRQAARKLDRHLVVLNASADSDFATVSAAIDQGKVDALFVAADPFFDDRREQIVSLAARHGIPACYTRRDFVVDGGLLSYGPDAPDAFRQADVYAGRILKGEKPADLPVMEPIKFEMVTNLKTAKALGLNVPATLLARADEVIE
jgi:putative ABC transport system substrate-binding protein